MPEIIILPAFFITLGFIVWTTVTALQQRHRLRLLTEFNAKVIDRLGSIHDFGEFAKTEAGARFLNGVVEEAPKVRPGERILRAAQIGIVLIAFGIGSLFLSDILRAQAGEAFVIVGVISLSLGVGFLVSSLVSHRISVALGLHSSPAAEGARTQQAAS